MYRVVSSPFSRSQQIHRDFSINGGLCFQPDFLSLSENLPPHNFNGDSAIITNYNNYYVTPNLKVDIQKTLLSTTSLYLEVKIQPLVSLTVIENSHAYYSFRFYLEGINVNCGSTYSVFGNSKLALSLSMPNK